jgi:isoleucyl-tRNA synthetase
VTHRDLIVGETLTTQFASGPVGADGSNGSVAGSRALSGAIEVVVGDNQPASILVVKR